MNKIYSRLIFLISFLTAVLLQTISTYAQEAKREALSANSKASDWTTSYVSSNNSTPYPWNKSNDPNTGILQLSILKNGNNGENNQTEAWAISPKVELYKGTTYAISFNCAVTVSDYSNTLYVVLKKANGTIVKTETFSGTSTASFNYSVEQDGLYTISFGIKAFDRIKAGFNISNIKIQTDEVTGVVKTFYNKGIADLHNLSNWRANANGSGLPPTSFAAPNQQFRIVNYFATDTIKLKGQYSISGVGSKTVLGNGTTPVVLETSNSNGNITNSIGVMDLTNESTLIVNAASAPILGIVDANSTVILGKNAPNILELNSDFGNLTVDRPGKLAKNIKVSGKIDFKNGKVDVGNYVLELTNTTNILNASPEKHILISGTGRVRKALSVQQRLGSVTIPVGSAAGYSPVTITGNSSNATFAVGVQDSDLSAAEAKTAANKTVKPIMSRTWNVSATASTSATITLSWMATTDADKLLVDGDEVHLMQFNGTSWEIAKEFLEVRKSGDVLSVTYSYNPADITPQSSLRASATQQAVAAPLGTTENSPTKDDVTVGSDVSVLPVDLLSFTAKVSERGAVVLNWATAQEKNNAYFEVQRSHDGKSFAAIGRRQGRGTTAIRANYSYTDTLPQAGTSYYRLRQVDTDGTFKILPTVVVNLKQETAPQMTLYPNPSEGQNVRLKVQGLPAGEEVKVLVADMMGKIVLRKELPANGAVLIPATRLKPGMYIVTARSKTMLITQKLSIK